eukprot:scaffold183522_cov17-Tisochrysis_lutea.AAC.3
MVRTPTKPRRRAMLPLGARWPMSMVTCTCNPQCQTRLQTGNREGHSVLRFLIHYHNRKPNMAYRQAPFRSVTASGFHLPRDNLHPLLKDILAEIGVSWWHGAHNRDFKKLLLSGSHE